MSANISKGKRLECWQSLEFHQKDIALLICPHLLRSRDMGQVDLAKIEFGKKVRVLEVKSRPEFQTHHQRRRLKESAKFLSLIFALPTILESSSVCKEN